jgi:hypothetical protein
MLTMIDQLFDRNYQEGRDALNANIARLASRFGAAFGNAFKVLNRIEYSEPWAPKRTRARCN